MIHLDIPDVYEQLYLSSTTTAQHFTQLSVTAQLSNSFSRLDGYQLLHRCALWEAYSQI